MMRAGSRGAVLRPQRGLHQTAADAARARAPSGVGLDSATVRRRMVARIRAGGVDCEPVLRAIADVERHRFVDSALAAQAYEDTALPIGLQQTISKPSVVARMLALLFGGDAAAAAGDLGRVLEIGTGCGYQAALLARLSTGVVSIERLFPLHQRAAANLAPFALTSVRLLHGDGRDGHAAGGPYRSIVAAAGGDALPPAWLAQLAPGGRLVAPVRDAASRGVQSLVVVDCRADGYATQRLEAVHFVPLESGTA